MLCVCYTEWYYAQCCYTECHNDECQNAVCYTECCCTECHNNECQNAVRVILSGIMLTVVMLSGVIVKVIEPMQ